MERFRKVLNLVFSLVLVLMLITAIGIEENSTFNRHDYRVDLSDGWTSTETDGARTEVTFPYQFQEGNAQLIRTLPQIEDHSVLLVSCKYNSLVAYVDGEEIYHSLPATFGMARTDVGHHVCLIPLSAEYSGKELVLNIEERKSGYNTNIEQIYLTSVAGYGFQQLENDVIKLLTAFAFLLVSLASFIAWFVLWRRHGMTVEESYHPFLWISLFTASMGTWFLTESYIWAISTGRYAASGIFNYISFSLLPVSFLGVLKSICSEKLASLRWIVIVAKVMLIAEWLLFLCGVMDLSDMLILLQVSCVVAVCIFAGFITWERQLFIVGDINYYVIWAILVTLVGAVGAYLVSGNWMKWALWGGAIIIISVLITVVQNIYRTLKDISQVKLFKEYALTDIMTGLKSRYAYTIFEEQQKTREISENLCLVFFDVDKLKKCNDTYGHAAGDEIVVATGECIRTAFGDVAECFRMGGDEFLVVITAKMEVVQERIVLFEQLASRWSGKYTDTLSVSYGIAAASEYPDVKFEDLVRIADKMMYQRKKQRAAC